MRIFMSVLIMLMGMIRTQGVVTLGNNSNTTAPSGNRGWDTQGNFGMTPATVVGKKYFLAATHVGGNVGDVFTIGGTNYTTISKTNDPSGSDCTLWKVNGTFPASCKATLYPGTNVIGKAITIFGRGYTRGTPVVRNCEPLIISNFIKGSTSNSFDVVGGSVSECFVIQRSTNLISWITLPGAYTVPGNQMIRISTPTTSDSTLFYRVAVTTPTITVGWQIQTYTGQLSWGTNIISGEEGGLPYSIFDRNGGADESCLTFYDSSGGAFTKDTDGKWKLIGINYGSLLGPYATDGSSFFYGTMMDMSGMYLMNPTPPYIPYQYPTNIGSMPGKSYYTKIPVAWINSVTGGQ